MAMDDLTLDFDPLQVIELEDVSLNILTIPVDERCAANCVLSVSVAVPRQSIELNEGINIHPLFDPGLPHTQTFYETLEVAQVLALCS